MDTPKDKVAMKRRRKFVGCSLLEHFDVGHKVGVGTFGEVVKAKHKNTEKIVALKKIFTQSEQEGFPITSLREIKLLKSVAHPNVASLIDMAVSYRPEDETGFKEVEDLYMVFPFMDHDLNGILENQNITLTLPQIKCYMKQMFEGIAHLHQKRIMHRDLKSANLLVNNRGELKITDFGLARPLEENRVKYTPGVVTRWYRPPELLLSSDHYDESVDIWGAGCIVAEMYLRKPLFGGNSDLEQLKLLFRYCGTPTEDSYPGVSKLPDFDKLQLKPEKRILRQYLESKGIAAEAVDLIDKMLVFDPKQRISAEEAQQHRYFKSDPLPCLPSQISKFESSHAYTVQMNKKEAEESSTPKRNNSHHSRGQRRDFDLPPPPPPPPIIDRKVHNNHHHQREDHRRRADYDRGEDRRQDYHDRSNHHHPRNGRSNSRESRSISPDRRSESSRQQSTGNRRTISYDDL